MIPHHVFVCNQGSTTDSGAVTVNGGRVTAKGSLGGAGIGTGQGGTGSVGAITVNGGVVEGTGALGGAGIGSGAVIYDVSDGTALKENLSEDQLFAYLDKKLH